MQRRAELSACLLGVLHFGLCGVMWGYVGLLYWVFVGIESCFKYLKVLDGIGINFPVHGRDMGGHLMALGQTFYAVLRVAAFLECRLFSSMLPSAFHVHGAIGMALKRRTWAMAEGPIKPDLLFTLEHASMQQPQVQQREIEKAHCCTDCRHRAATQVKLPSTGTQA